MIISHRANLIDTLQNDIARHLELVSADHQAFVRLAAEWLGYSELEEEKHFVDGSGDRGVDFWYSSASGFEVFQVKSHERGVSGRVQTERFDSQGVQDLQRIVSLLTHEKPEVGGSRKLANFRKQWEYAITTRRLAEAGEEPFLVSLGLVLFGDGLTEPAQQEYDAFCNTLKNPMSYREVPVEFRARLYTMDDIIMARWREDNREWRDKDGKKRDSIELEPELRGKEPKWIPGRHNAVFYCRAIDLISAFEDFGYQIFEPNVRANIQKLKVNAAIKKSLTHYTSRKEFQFLNNGLTITCTRYSNPSRNRPAFRVTEPGVVNGLQTVVTLHEAYFELDGAEKKHLEENCYVLVRLLSGEAVKDVNKVVLASNTQNPMQARNLRSNTTEQVYYERLFAQLGWFYERKQGAWDAFKKDPSRWRTLPNHRTSSFVSTGLGKRTRYRKVDNELLAQTWVAFIGFSSDAVHNKRYLFEEDDWYDLAFLHRTPRHAAQFGYQASTARDEWIDEAPAPASMLVSFLARQLAKEVRLSSRENRESACERLRLDPDNIPREELDVSLSKDDDYLLEQVLSGMSFVFVEFFGYLLYEALGEDIHSAGSRLLQNGSLKYLSGTVDFETVAKNVHSGQTEPDDLLVVAWLAFRHTIDQLMAGPWKQSYQTARNRTRFNHSIDTRSRICKQVDELNKFMEKSQLIQVWAAGIPARIGLYQYFRSILSSGRC